MPLTVLTDADVRQVLESLTREDVQQLQVALRDALHNYSTALESSESGCCADNQPSRIAVKGKNGATTLFMPATADSGSGVKMVSISESSGASNASNLPVLSDKASDTSRSSLSASTREGSIVSTASSSSPPTAAKADSRIIPQFDSSGSRPDPPPAGTTPKGSITLLSPDGQPRAIVNATTLTAFRTALASTLLFKLRASVHDITVFGAGHQAYWHIYLAVLLRGPEIHHLNVINRNFDRAQRLYIELAQSPNPAVQDVFLGDRKFKPSLLTPEHVEYARLLKEFVRAADVIFCCTPSTTPLFPAGYLTHTEGRRKARYIAAIGSYKPHMQELHVDILRQAVAGPNADKSHGGIFHLHHKHAREGGAVVVDSIEGAMREAGEIINSGIGGRGIVEIGELVMLKRSHWAEKAEREKEERSAHEQAGKEQHHGGGHGLGHLFHLGGHHDADKKSGHARSKSQTRPATDHGYTGGMADWLERGNVIYKSVGIGLMDVVVGMEIVRLAEARGIGTFVPDF